MSRRTKEDKEAEELLVNMFVVWPLKAIEAFANGILSIGEWMTRKVVQHDEKKKQKESNIVYNELED